MYNNCGLCQPHITILASCACCVAYADLRTRTVILASQGQQSLPNNLVDQVAAGGQICLLSTLGGLVGSTEHCSCLEKMPYSLLHSFLLLFLWQASMRLMELSIALHYIHTSWAPQYIEMSRRRQLDTVQTFELDILSFQGDMLLCKDGWAINNMQRQGQEGVVNTVK